MSWPTSLPLRATMRHAMAFRLKGHRDLPWAAPLPPRQPPAKPLGSDRTHPENMTNVKEATEHPEAWTGTAKARTQPLGVSDEFWQLSP